MHTIRELADKFGLTLRALRFYEDKKLIAPTRKGTRRLYSDDDVARLKLITRWRAAGINVQDIRQLLAMLDRGEALAVRARVSKILATIEEEARHRLKAIQVLRKAA